MGQRKLIAGYYVPDAIPFTADVQPEVIDLDFTKRHGPVEVFDANGNRLQHIRKANLKTGECVKIVTDAKGKKIVDFVHREVITETVYYPAPLRYEFKNADAS